MYQMSQSTIVKINIGTALTCFLVILGWGVDRGITAQKLNIIFEYVTESKNRIQRLEMQDADRANKLSVLEQEINYLKRTK